MSTAASAVRHAAGVGIEALLLLAIVAALIFGAATLGGIRPAGADSVFAAKGGNGGGGGHSGAGGGASGGGSSGGYSISVLGTAGFASTSITYGSTVTTYSSYGDADPAYARVMCTANSSTVTTLAQGAVVYDVFRSVREGDWNTGGYSSFDTTSSGGWTGGGADCTASLLTYVMHNADRIWKDLASTTFIVLP